MADDGRKSGSAARGGPAETFNVAHCRFGALGQDMVVNKTDVIKDILQEVDIDKDGRISYEEFAAMMRRGTDWRKASRQYSRDRFNSLSTRLFRDGSTNPPNFSKQNER